MRRTFFLLGFLCMTLAGCLWKTDAKAFDVERYSKEDAGYLGDAIPEKIIEDIEKNTSGLIDDALSDEEIIFQNIYEKLDRKKAVKILAPFIIWDEGNKQELYYYFPIMQNGEILANVVASDIHWDGGRFFKGEPEFSLDEELVDELNDIDYAGEEYVMYYYEDCTYAENPKEKHRLQENIRRPANVSMKKEQAFYDKSFTKKKEMVIRKVWEVEKNGDYKKSTVWTFPVGILCVGLVVAVLILLKKKGKTIVVR